MHVPPIILPLPHILLACDLTKPPPEASSLFLFLTLLYNSIKLCMTEIKPEWVVVIVQLLSLIEVVVQVVPGKCLREL